jgi:hypothetical protein
MNKMLTHTDDWVDVTQRLDHYRDVFDIPNEDALKNLEVKDRVKISNGFERFFVFVTGIDGNIVYGKIENHLIGKYDYDYKDVVHFEKKNIFMIKKYDGLADQQKNKKTKTTKRMLKLLGVDPTENSKEAMAVMSILQNK